MAGPDRLSKTPRELRDRYYKHALKGVRVLHVKCTFARNKQFKPYRGQWLVPVTPANSPLVQIAGTNRRINGEVYECLKHRALKYGYIKSIARALNFDFRALTKFLESLTPAEITRINNATQPKVIVLLTVTGANALDGKKFGTWLKFRKTNGVTLTYSVGADPGFNADLQGLYLVKTAFDGDEEMTKIYKACAEYQYAPEDVELQVKRWYNPRTRDVEEESDDEMEESLLREARGRVGGSEGAGPGSKSKKINTVKPRVRAAAKSTGTAGLLGQGAARLIQADEGEENDEVEVDGESGNEDLNSEMMSGSDEEMVSDSDDETMSDSDGD